MRPSHLLPVLASLAGGGCSRQVEISNDVDPSAPATVLVLGEPRAELRGATLALRLPKSQRKTESDGTHTTGCIVDCDSEGPSSVVTVRLATRCGPVEYCVDFSKKAGQGDAQGAEGPWRGILMGRHRPPFASCTNEVFRIWVDNRGGVGHGGGMGGMGGMGGWARTPVPPGAARPTHVEQSRQWRDHRPSANADHRTAKASIDGLGVQ